MLRKIRTILAVIVFTAVTLLFLDFTGALHTYLGWLSKIQFLPAALALNIGVMAAILALTLLLGRIYCSVICPLGIFQDGVSHLSGLRKKKKMRFKYRKEHKIARYVVLALVMIALVFGLNSFVALLSPYSAYGRMVQNLLSPIYQWGNNFFAYLAERADSYAFYSREVWMRSLPTFVVAVFTLIVITFLSWKDGRAYCNTICPVGTFLSFFARHAWFKMHIDEDACVSCGLCAKKCKASCIDPKNHTIDYSRCVVCGDCIDNCKKKAISFTHKSSKKASLTQGTDSARRAFLVGTALATTELAFGQGKKKVDGGLAVIEKKKAPHRDTPITPPGSLSVKNMYGHCTACQLCVSVCPNDVLRPSVDLQHFMQPMMSYERGYCRPECNKCSQVCPAGAIRPISVEEKSSISIGHAVWIKQNCLPVSDDVSCGNCARHCPTGAIKMVPLDPNDHHSKHVPTIDTERCIGCGTCENLCPARPLSAIYVEGNEIHRTI